MGDKLRQLWCALRGHGGVQFDRTRWGTVYSCKRCWAVFFERDKGK